MSFKSTITLQNGVIAQIECETADGLSQVLTSYGGNATKESDSVPGGVNLVRKAVSARKGIGSRVRWSANEVISAAKNILEAKASGASLDTATTRTLAKLDVRRTMTAVATMVSRMHRYLMGDPKHNLPKNVVRTLKESGFNPRMTPTSAYETPTSERTSHRTRVRWSARDIVEIGKIVRDNLSAGHRLNKLTRSYVKRSGDVRLRSQASVYTLTIAIRDYILTGKTDNKLGIRVEQVLNSAGIVPQQQGTPVPFQRVHEVQEA